MTKKTSFFILLLALLPGLLLCYNLVREKPLKIHMIDVGEGDAFLIQTPNKEVILIDTGNPVTGYKVAQYLKKRKVKQIDHLFFSHPDQDHIGGTFFVMQEFPVKNIYDNGENLTKLHKDSDFYYWYDTVVRNHQNYRNLRAGDTLKAGEVTIKVLWPPTPLPHDWFNPNSLTLMLQWGDFKALFTGDLINFAEVELIQTGVDLKADLLKCGHHASNDTTTQAFLDKVSPKVALVSANHGKRRDYPGKKAIERLKRKNIPFYRTDLNGDVTLLINKNGHITVKTSK